MKNKLLKALLIAALVLLVPFLIGRVSVVVLDRVYPAVELPSPAERCRELDMPIGPCIDAINKEPESVTETVRSLRRARAITKVTLVIIGVYYLALIAVWLIRRRLRRDKAARLSSEVII